MVEYSTSLLPSLIYFIYLEIRHTVRDLREEAVTWPLRDGMERSTVRPVRQLKCALCMYVECWAYLSACGDEWCMSGVSEFVWKGRWE